MKNILFASSECVPFIKTGGLADVVGSLPKDFDKEKYDCRVVLPKYMCMKQEWVERLEYITNFYMDFAGENRYVGIFKTELNGVTIQVPKQVTFDIDNINFGIIRRPVQSISVEKRISHVTVKYTSGDILIDADIDENGKLTGQTNYLTYIKPTVSNGKRVNGFLRAELDSEVVQNSSLEITYRFTAKNNSEADYASQGFYNFGNGYYSSRGQAGETQKEKDVVTISPSKMIDYLDKELLFILTINIPKNTTGINTDGNTHCTKNIGFLNSILNSFATYDFPTEFIFMSLPVIFFPFFAPEDKLPTAPLK